MRHTEGYSRRRLLTLAAQAAALLTIDRALAGSVAPTETVLPTAGDQTMQTRAIPSSSEALPMVGLGTYRGFDVAPGDPVYRQLPAVLEALFRKGGTLIDSSPMYGRAEQTTGELLSIHEPRSPAFLATKVWTRGRDEGIAQMEQSFRLLQTERIDLMQLHNYALDDRAVEKRILPLCRERGVAVICNRPFGGGDLLARLKGKPLPAWVSDVQVNSWPKLALKFLLAHPAVTCVIPGTSNPRYMADNAGAGFGPMLTDAQRHQLIALLG